MKAYLTVDEILERALILIADHELIKNPIVVNNAGTPIRITKFRTYDGFDLNFDGLTLSIFPYSYQGTSNETVGSTNAALVFEPYNVGSGTEGFDRAKLALIVKLQTTGNEPLNTESNYPTPVIERQAREVALYRWLNVLHSILLTKPLQDLGGLIRNSTINWGSFRSTKWDGQKGENYVLHSASLLWQMDYNVPRNWRLLPAKITLPNIGVQPAWVYVGVRNIDKVLIFWDTVSGFLTTVSGFPVSVTPLGEPVKWDTLLGKFRSKTDNRLLTEPELIDPNYFIPDVDPPTPGPWINTDLILVGVIMPTKEYIFYNRKTLRIEDINGNPIVTLPDGTPIAVAPNPTPTTWPGVLVVPPSSESTSPTILDSSEVVSPSTGTPPATDPTTGLPPQPSSSPTLDPAASPVVNPELPSTVTIPVIISPDQATTPGQLIVINPITNNPIPRSEIFIPLVLVSFNIYDVNALKLKNTDAGDIASRRSETFGF